MYLFSIYISRSKSQNSSMSNALDERHFEFRHTRCYSRDYSRIKYTTIKLKSYYLPQRLKKLMQFEFFLRTEQYSSQRASDCKKKEMSLIYLHFYPSMQYSNRYQQKEMYEQRKVKYKNMSCHKNVVQYINIQYFVLGIYVSISDRYLQHFKYLNDACLKTSI